MSLKLISIIVPAFNEEGCLSNLHNEIVKVFSTTQYHWELIIVDDGSTDKTRSIIELIVKKDSKVRGIHFARNFGHQYALLAGIEDAKGDAIVTIDADLEQPPCVILQMIDQWEKGYQIVNSVRKDHPKKSIFKKLTSKWFYKIFSFLSQIPMEPGMLDFRLIDKQVAKAVLSITEADFFLRGITSWIGYKQIRIPYQSGIRTSGETKYSTRKMIHFAIQGITSFSTFPLRLATYIGTIMTLFSICYGSYVGVMHFFWKYPQPGYASTIILIALLMGVQFLLIGTLGEYVAKIHIEVKRRPRYLIANTTKNSSTSFNKTNNLKTNEQNKTCN